MSNSRRCGLQWLGAVFGFAAAGVAIGWQVAERRSAGPEGDIAAAAGAVASAVGTAAEPVALSGH